MKEINDIISAFHQARAEKLRTALATVVHVEGSSYRRAGARMLIREDGQLTGAISGGCLEGDALKKAMLAITSGDTLLVTYDTNDEDDATLGMGLGCNGVIQVLIEPIDPEREHNPLVLLETATLTRAPVVMVTFFSLADRKGGQPGSCLLMNAEGIVTGPGELALLVQKDMKEAEAHHRSAWVQYDNSDRSLTAFIEYIPPPVQLVIAGAGNDALPLVQMATLLGWKVIVADGRANYLAAHRFPAVEKRIVAKPAAAVQQLSIDQRTVFVLLTHNYQYDLDFITALEPHRPVYIGLLGPAKKRDRIVTELNEKKRIEDPSFLTALYGPAGIDIGAETPAEIACSIIAEIQMVLGSRKGGSLRDRTEGIHPREIIQSTQQSR